MNAYSETYLADSMETLGEMLDYAVHGRRMPLEEFYLRFLACSAADSFGNGSPKYIAGMSGIELAQEVLACTESESAPACDYLPGPPGPEYWCGWALAYLQWYSGLSFAFIQHNGLPIGDIERMYSPLHEADISKFADIALRRIATYRRNMKNPVKRRRKALGLTQKALAERCGISLRMVQAYEQGRQDLSKAEASTLLCLAHVLRCPPEELAVQVTMLPH